MEEPVNMPLNDTEPAPSNKKRAIIIAISISIVVVIVGLIFFLTTKSGVSVDVVADDGATCVSEDQRIEFDCPSGIKIVSEGRSQRIDADFYIIELTDGYSISVGPEVYSAGYELVKEDKASDYWGSIEVTVRRSHQSPSLDPLWIYAKAAKDGIIAEVSKEISDQYVKSLTEETVKNIESDFLNIYDTEVDTLLGITESLRYGVSGSNTTQLNGYTNEYDGWNVYKDNDYGFEIRYPNDVTLSESDHTETHPTCEIQKRCKYFSLNYPTHAYKGALSNVLIYVTDSSAQEQIDTIGHGSVAQDPIISNKLTTINGYEAAKLKVKSDLGLDFDYIITRLKEGDKTFVIKYIEGDVYHDKIVNSFRFINTNSGLLVYPGSGQALKIGETVVIDWSSIKNIADNTFITFYLLDEAGEELGHILSSPHGSNFASKGSKEWFVNSYSIGSEVLGNHQLVDIVAGKYKIKILLDDQRESRDQVVSDLFEIK